MANRTDTQADTVHGTNPQYLVDRIVRLKIHNDAYWKEFCFALTNETLIDQAAELDYVCGTYGGRRRPAKFLCLLLKMLQIQPDEDVVMEFIKQPDLKYLRALGVTYLRLTGRAKTIYETLEPLYADYRKLRYRNMQGKLSLIHMDELIDWLFHEETIVDITMPALPKREILEFSDMLKPKESILDDDLEDLEELEAAVDPQKAPSRSPSPTAVAAPEASATVAPSAETTEAPERRSATPARDEKDGKASSPPRRPAARSKSRQRSRSRRQESDRRTRTRRSPSRSGSRERKDRKKDRDKKDKQKEKDREREREKDREREKEKGEKREKKDKKDGKGKKDKKERNDDRSDEDEKKERYREEPKKKKGMFKGDEVKSAKESKQRSGDGKSSKEKDGLSVDAWNDVRKQLGLKPLN